MSALEKAVDELQKRFKIEDFDGFICTTPNYRPATKSEITACLKPFFEEAINEYDAKLRANFEKQERFQK